MGSSRLIAAVLLAATSGLLGHVTQDWQWAVSQNLTRERIAGLLNLPDIVGEGCGPSQRVSATLYDAPSASGHSIGSVTFRVADREPDGSSCGAAQVIVQRTDGSPDEELPTDESDYEIPSAVVYERSGAWFRIALQRGSAWLTRDHPADFQSYPELLKDRLAYIRKGWGGRLWQTPGAGPGVQIPVAWTRHLTDNIPVEVLEVQHLAGGSWIRVRLQTESCGERLEDVEPATGWIQAYQPSGRPAVWFYARGC